MNGSSGNLNDIAGSATARQRFTTMCAQKSWPISWHLALLAFAAFAPAMVLCGWLLSRHIADAQLNIEHDAAAQAEMWSRSIDQVLSSSVGTLRALAASAALKTRNYESFTEQADASFIGSGIAVTIRDRKLNHLGATANKNGDEPESSLLSQDEVRQALSSTLPIVTGFREASAAASAGVDIWIRAGSRADPLLLQARVPSDYLGRWLATASVDVPWSVALIDRSQRVIARSRNFTNELGATLADNLPPAAPGAGLSNAIISRAADAADSPIIKASAAATDYGWRISATAPVDKLEHRLQQHWRGFLLVATLLGCLMAGGTGWVAASISRAISTLSENARGLTSNAQQAPVETTILEVRQLLDVIGKTRLELARQNTALRASDHRLRMALDAGRMGVWEWERDNDVMVWDAVEFDLVGLPRDAPTPTGKEFAARIIEEDRAMVATAMANLSRDNPAFAVDYRFKRFDGEVRWLAGRGLLLADDTGAPRGLVGVNFDTTEQRRNVERTAALLREVSHRSKNMLALILAMARLTARDATDVQSHVKEFSARVAGLAASQDMIVAADWQNVDIAKLTAAEARAIAHDGAERMDISGPVVTVRPEAAQTLGMAFTELTLNAMQHGALSVASGRVAVTWLIEGDTLAMTWCETGGPEAPENFHRGYGMSVIERFVEQGLHAKVDVKTGRSGFEWKFTAPLGNLGASVTRG